MEEGSSAVAITMMGVPVAALFLAMYLAWLSLTRRIVRGVERFQSDDAWEPVDFSSEGRGGADLRPLLELALQREAARRGADFRVGLRGRGLKVTGAWRERVALGARGDRWHRWAVDACFFRVNEGYGTCESLDVRAKTAFLSSTPPNDWPIAVRPSSASPSKGGTDKVPPVPTSELL